MKKLTIMMVLFVTFLAGCLLYIGYSVKNNIKPYKKYENDMVENAKAYILSNKISLDVSQEYELTINKMMEDNMLSTNKVNEDECDGKVTIKRNFKGYDYKPYIKCKNYESIND